MKRTQSIPPAFKFSFFLVCFLMATPFLKAQGPKWATGGNDIINSDFIGSTK